jgi:hypothetical protein
VDARFWTCDGAIDAFVRQHQRAFDLVGLATGLQRRLQFDKVGQIDEFAEGGSELGSRSTCRDFSL